jgi:hypothetical protein
VAHAVLRFLVLLLLILFLILLFIFRLLGGYGPTEPVKPHGISLHYTPPQPPCNETQIGTCDQRTTY